MKYPILTYSILSSSSMRPISSRNSLPVRLISGCIIVISSCVELAHPISKVLVPVPAIHFISTLTKPDSMTVSSHVIRALKVLPSPIILLPKLSDTFVYIRYLLLLYQVNSNPCIPVHSITYVIYRVCRSACIHPLCYILLCSWILEFNIKKRIIDCTLYKCYL